MGNYLKLTVYITVMVTINKPKSITITIRDRANNKSRSITVYNAKLDDVTEKIKIALHD